MRRRRRQNARHFATKICAVPGRYSMSVIEEARRLLSRTSYRPGRQAVAAPIPSLAARQPASPDSDHRGRSRRFEARHPGSVPTEAKYFHCCRPHRCFPWTRALKHMKAKMARTRQKRQLRRIRPRAQGGMRDSFMQSFTSAWVPEHADSPISASHSLTKADLAVLEPGTFPGLRNF